MKRRAVSGLILMLLSTSILTLTFNSQSAKADGEYVLSAWADITPAMDGILALGEWDDAASVSFTLVWEPDESHSVTLYEKNDAQYLYLGATVLDDDFDNQDMAVFYFDNAHDGGLDDGDDWIYVVAWTTGQGHAVDGYFNASENCWHSDTTHGGTNDILGGSSHTNVGGMGDYAFELRHPLNSEDDAHDISLELGDMVGVRMAYNDAFPGGATGSTWPGLLEFADIIIAHAPGTINELKSETEELGFEGQIDNKGIVKSLLAKLNAAQKLVDEGKIDQAKNILNAFINELQAQSGKHITPEAAETLIQAAEHILSSL